jgi:hypothetical protein
MTTIYTRHGLLPIDWFSQYSSTSSSFEHSFDIQPELLEYKLINKDDDTTIIHIKLTLAELQQANRFYSQTMFGVYNSAIKLDGSLVNLNSSDLSSLFQSTLPSKSLFLQNSTVNNNTMLLPFRIFVTYASDDFTKFKYHLAKVQGEEAPTVTVNTNNTATYNPTPTNWKSLIDDVLTLSTNQSNITPGDKILVTIQSSNTNLDYVYLEQVSGILDRTKVALTNGTGSFNILTDTLSSGDVAEVKYGYKLYTGIGTFTKSIV